MVRATKCIYIIQWNLSIMDTIGDQHFVYYSGVSLTRVSGIFYVGVVLRILAVEYNEFAFSELYFAVCWQGRLGRG